MKHGLLNKWCQENISSRDEIYEKNSRIHLDRLQKNLHIAKELEITPVLDKLLEFKRNWIQQVNRMPRDRLPRLMKHYSSTGRRNRGRPLKRLLDTWDRNGSTSGLTPWQTYDDDLNYIQVNSFLRLSALYSAFLSLILTVLSCWCYFPVSFVNIKQDIFQRLLQMVCFNIFCGRSTYFLHACNLNIFSSTHITYTL